MARLKKWSTPSVAFQRFGMWVLGMTAITTLSSKVLPHFPIQAYVLFMILLIIKTEFQKNENQDRAQTIGLSPAFSRKNFWLSLSSLIIAATFSALDAARVLCFPENHFFQGHGMWHLMGALALFFSYRHYLQFEKEMH